MPQRRCRVSIGVNANLAHGAAGPALRIVGQRSGATGAVSLRRRRLVDICGASTSIPRIAVWPDVPPLAGHARGRHPSQIVHAGRLFALHRYNHTRSRPHTPDIGPDPDWEEFAPDSPLEGDGFELSVPHERGHRFELSFFVYVPETVRVLAQRTTLLGAGGSKSRVPPGRWGELPIAGKRPRLGRTA